MVAPRQRAVCVSRYTASVVTAHDNEKTTFSLKTSWWGKQTYTSELSSSTKRETCDRGAQQIWAVINSMFKRQ